MNPLVILEGKMNKIKRIATGVVCMNKGIASEVKSVWEICRLYDLKHPKEICWGKVCRDLKLSAKLNNNNLNSVCFSTLLYYHKFVN